MHCLDFQLTRARAEFGKQRPFESRGCTCTCTCRCTSADIAIAIAAAKITAAATAVPSRRGPFERVLGLGLGLGSRVPAAAAASAASAEEDELLGGDGGGAGGSIDSAAALDDPREGPLEGAAASDGLRPLQRTGYCSE